MIFKNRAQAGKYLAEAISTKKYKDLFVFGIPRGGVVVAAQVAKIIGVPLDVVVIRKLGVPFDPELAFGAIGPKGILALEHEFVERIGLSVNEMESVRMGEEEELNRRINLYRGKRPYPDIAGKTALLVDDGIATGSTALAAIRFTKLFKPIKTIMAAPVCAPDSLEKIEKEAEVVFLDAPEDFWGVGQFYEDFPQVTDEEVKTTLANLGYNSF